MLLKPTRDSCCNGKVRYGWWVPLDSRTKEHVNYSLASESYLSPSFDHVRLLVFLTAVPSPSTLLQSSSTFVILRMERSVNSDLTLEDLIVSFVKLSISLLTKRPSVSSTKMHWRPPSHDSSTRDKSVPFSRGNHTNRATACVEMSVGKDDPIIQR